MIEIKKYSNRRLYNTETSAYVTQDDIVELIKENANFKKTDLKIMSMSNDLSQISVEKWTD